MNVLGADEGLQLRQRKRKESRVTGADQQGLIAVFIAAGHEGHQDQLLTGQPLVSIHLQGVEVVAVNVLEAGLVGGLVVTDAHAVRVAAAHVVLRIVDHCTVLAANHVGLLHKSAVYIVGNVDLLGAAVAKDQIIQHLLRFGDNDAGAVVQNHFQIARKHEFFQ